MEGGSTWAGPGQLGRGHPGLSPLVGYIGWGWAQRGGLQRGAEHAVGPGGHRVEWGGVWMEFGVGTQGSACPEFPRRPAVRSAGGGQAPLSLVCISGPRRDVRARAPLAGLPQSGVSESSRVLDLNPVTHRAAEVCASWPPRGCRSAGCVWGHRGSARCGRVAGEPGGSGCGLGTPLRTKLWGCVPESSGLCVRGNAGSGEEKGKAAFQKGAWERRVRVSKDLTSSLRRMFRSTDL